MKAVMLHRSWAQESKRWLTIMINTCEIHGRAIYNNPRSIRANLCLEIKWTRNAYRKPNWLLKKNCQSPIRATRMGLARTGKMKQPLYFVKILLWSALPPLQTHGPPILNLTGNYIHTAVSEHFLTSNHCDNHMLLIPIENLKWAWFFQESTWSPPYP